MTKLERLNKYKAKVKDLMDTKTPEKHLEHEHTYRQFLDHEMALVKSQIEALLLTGTK